jgi:hypothetical protein
MSDWQLAQINVGRMIAPQGDPAVQPFFDALDEVNALADASPGFVWRLVGEEGANATDIQPTADPLLLMNMSVWTDADALFAFVFRSSHTPVMARRRDWFEPFGGAHMACGGFRPAPSPRSMTACRGSGTSTGSGRRRTPSPSNCVSAAGVADAPVDMQPDPWCVGRA